METHSFTHEGRLPTSYAQRGIQQHTLLKTAQGKNLHYHQRVAELRSASLVQVKTKQTHLQPRRTRQTRARRAPSTQHDDSCRLRREAPRIGLRDAKLAAYGRCALA